VLEFTGTSTVLEMVCECTLRPGMNDVSMHASMHACFGR